MADRVQGATIVSVTPSSVNTKRGPAIKHTIVLGSGAELQTFKQDLANTAAQLIGRPVDIEYDVSQNGEWTNFYPVSIVPASNPALQSQMAQAAAGLGTPGGQFAAQITQASAPQASVLAGDYFAEPKTLSIHRQKASDVAAQLGTDNPATYWANVEALVRFYNTGATPADFAALDGDPDADIPF